jgi:hypothetical protein
MTDSKKDVKDDIYANYLNNEHFHSFPPAMDMNPNTHIVTAYIDEALFKSCDYNYRVTIDNFNASIEFHITPEQKNSNTRTIDLGMIPIFQAPEKIAPYVAEALIDQSQGLDASQLPKNPKLITQ